MDCINVIIRANDSLTAFQYVKQFSEHCRSNLLTLNCEDLKKPGDLGTLSSLKANDVLFLYGLHKLGMDSEYVRYLHDAIIDKRLNIEFIKGSFINIDLAPFNLVVHLNDGEELPSYMEGTDFKFEVNYIPDMPKKEKKTN